MTYRDFWTANYLAKASAGISPEKAADIADRAVKELKSRDDSPSSAWNSVVPTAAPTN
jgi:hypothetical protein